MHLVQSDLTVGAVNRAVTALSFSYKVTMGQRDAPDMIYARANDTSDQRAPELPRWIHRYNRHGPHGSIGSKPPISRLSKLRTTF